MGTRSPLATPANTSPVDTSNEAPGVRSCFLAFKLGREEYGVPIESVKEIHAYMAPRTIVPSSTHVAGIIDLRGSIAPAVDLRRMVDAPPARHPMPPAVIALRMGCELVGVIVDSVSGVVELTEDQMLPVPRPNTAADADMLIAIGAIEERFLILVDVAKILGMADLGLKAGVLH